MRKFNLQLTMGLITVMLAIAGCSGPAKNQTASTAQTIEAKTEAEVTDTLAEMEDIDVPADQQQRLLAFGAVLATRNNIDFLTLVGMDKSLMKDMGEMYKTIDRDELQAAFGEAYKKVLNDSWSVADRASAIETLDLLRDQGHRDYPDYPFDQVLALIRSGETEGYEAEASACADVYTALTEEYGYSQEELDAISTVSAWDYDRLVVVARWCYVAGFITEQEAWDYIKAAAEQGSSDYKDWKSYFAGILLGRAIWTGEHGFDPGNRAIADQLLVDENSIYQQVSFK